jgi:hypothetical protein
MSAQSIIEKLNDLPPDKVLEVEDFIDFLRQRAQREQDDIELTKAMTTLSADAFNRVWDNPEDAVYDAL